MDNPVEALVRAILAIDQISDNDLDAALDETELTPMAVKACLVPTAARLQSAFHRARMRANSSSNPESPDEQPGIESAEETPADA